MYSYNSKIELLNHITHSTRSEFKTALTPHPKVSISQHAAHPNHTKTYVAVVYTP